MTWLLFLPFLLLLDANADPPPDDDDDNDEDDEEEEEEDDEPTRDPEARIKSLKAANTRLSKKLKKRNAKIKELEEAGGADGDELRTARLENAFLRGAIERDDAIEDLDTAWTLATTKGYFDSLKVDDNGAVDGMPKALDKLCDRYPYLVTDGDDDEPDASRPSNTGRTPRITKSSTQATSRSNLGQRFPALRSRVRRGRAS